MARINDEAAIRIVEKAVESYPDLEDQLERMKDAFVLKYGEDIDEPKKPVKKKSSKK